MLIGSHLMKTLHRLVAIAALLTTVTGTQAATKSPSNVTPVKPLKPGVTQPISLSSAEKHLYSVKLKAGEYLEVIAEQNGISIVLTWRIPGETKSQRIEYPTGEQGPQWLTQIASSTGEYYLKIEATDPNAKPGHYQLKVWYHPKPTRADISRARATEAFWKGWRGFDTRPHLAAQGDFSLAVELWREVKERRFEALTMEAISLKFEAAREYQIALKYRKQELDAYRAMNDSIAEARVTEQIAKIQSNLARQSAP
jgi:hypothetical protein